MEYFLDAMNKYAEFEGRATRKQFWMFVLFYILIYLALALVSGLIGTAILPMLFGLAVLVPSLSIGARRLHDTGRSGWWQLIGLVPVIGTIVLIVFFVQDSVGDNEYGPRQ